MPLKSGPGRLLRRNHYQEGPDFLFLATQGGRPPDADVGSSVASVVRLRAGALRRWRDGEPATQVAASLGIGRATLYRWQERHDAHGLEGLIDAPRLGRASELDPVLERVIITVRLLTNWNSRRIAAEFGRRDIHVGPGQVDRLLTRYGTHRSSTPRIPGPRYERGTPNELWHIDLKGPLYPHPATGPIRTCHFVALVDDHGRYLLGIRAVPSKEALAILDVLGEAIELCGIPLALC
jgi:transposase